MKALRDNVFVQVEEVEEVTSGGIILQNVKKERPDKGVVYEVGPGTPDNPTKLKKGDKVLFGKHAGVSMEIDGVDLLVMREGDIIAIL